MRTIQQAMYSLCLLQTYFCLPRKTVHRSLAILLLLTTLAGCSKQEATSGSHALPGADGAAAPAAKRTVAYRHALDVEVAEDKVVQVFEAGQAACRAMTAEHCTVMGAQLTGPGRGSGRAYRDAAATLTLRALPAAIPKLQAVFGTRGAIVRQSTSGEELAGPLADQVRKLALLVDYRTRLEGLRTQAASNIDSLIKVNQELAQVQGQIEEASGQQAAMQQRVDTELLEVSIQSQQQSSFWRPIGAAASEFGASLSQGIASAISGAAYLIPWAILLGLVAWIARKLWRRKK
jgi:predicted small lipoprotein YifL